jgi:hypothetical protein
VDFSVDSDLRDEARELGYVATACPACRSPAGACANCGGSGRVWNEGSASLDDAGMRRLIELHAGLRNVDPRGIFAPRVPSGLRGSALAG